MFDTLDVQRSPTFSLGTALLWLGHSCRRRCPPEITERRADVWFLQLPEHLVASWNATLVEVAFRDNVADADERKRLLSAVNRCLWADRMRVRERTAIERENFFAALEARRSAQRVLRSEAVAGTSLADTCAAG